MAKEIGIQDFKKNITILQNMYESQKVERFKFTPTEELALKFAIDLMKSTLEEFEEETT